jgi:hypothetical protein
MSTRLDQRGWAAAQDLAPCALCHRPAIMRAPRGKPCHLTCAQAWTNEHEDQDHEHAEARRGKCAACKGGGLLPAPGCTCNGTVHTCVPVVCTVCNGTGLARPSCH